MAFGLHWEWRGFGRLPQGLRREIEELPLKFPTSQEVTDEYLWIPGATVNVKLRFQDLKLKRLIEKEGPFQHWLEDESENFSFPLSGAVVAELARCLGVSLPSITVDGVQRPELLAILGESRPKISRVTVVKSRWQHDLTLPRSDATPDDMEPVTVELAHIHSPEATTSVGLEHPNLDCLRRAWDSLGAHEHLRGLSYLDAVDTWARGEQVAAD